MQKTLNGVSARVLFDAESRETSFPDVPVTYITCKRSVWFCAWAEMVTRKRYEAAIEKGEKVRPIKFFSLDDNHFVSAPSFHVGFPQKRLNHSYRPTGTIPNVCLRLSLRELAASAMLRLVYSHYQVAYSCLSLTLICGVDSECLIPGVWRIRYKTSLSSSLCYQPFRRFIFDPTCSVLKSLSALMAMSLLIVNWC